MKALYFAHAEAVELIDTDDFEETLGGPVDYLWPFEDESVCFVTLADRDVLPPNRVFEEYGTICGSFLCIGCHDNFDDLTEEEISFVESHATFAEEVYEEPSCDPCEDDLDEEEDYRGIRIVGEDEFYECITGNYF